MKKNLSESLSTNPYVIALMHFIGILSKISLGSFSVTFLYLTLVYWGDNIRNLSKFPISEQNYYVTAISNTILIFEISVIGILVFTSICNIKYSFYSKVLVLVSFIFAYGIPYVFVKYTPQSDFSIPVLVRILNAYSEMGKIVLFFAIILYSRDLCNTILNAFNKLKDNNKVKSKTQKKGSFLSLGLNCWNTGYCSKELKDICPAFMLKKNCWKLKIGCCDPTMFLMASGSEYSKHLLKDISLESNIQNKIESCRKCHIFLVHQRKKYKLYLPIIILIAVVIGYFIYQTLWGFFSDAIVSIDKFARFLIPDSGSITDMQSALTVMVLFLVAITILLIITVMVQLLHYSIFRLKI